MNGCVVGSFVRRTETRWRCWNCRVASRRRSWRAADRLGIKLEASDGAEAEGMVEFCGEELDAWFYEAARQAAHPAVVMRHGLGAVKAGGLAPFAERFCREGFAVSAIDCRQWGGSSWHPRDELNVPRQRQDYSTAIGWAAAHPKIDAQRIFAWGTSFAGMHVTEPAPSDSRLAVLADHAHRHLLASARHRPASRS